MVSLAELVGAHTTLSADDTAWLQRLTSDWQIVADLSFADLVLWLPDHGGAGHWAGAQVRPNTGPTAHVDDLVGTFVPRGRRPLLDVALDEGRIAREGDPTWRSDVPVRVEAIPVRRATPDGLRTLAVVARNTNLLGVRTPSRLELAYIQTATDLARMIAAGEFPLGERWEEETDSPRVGDGFIRLGKDGRVEYASPNALSVYRRLGLSSDLTGLDFAAVTRELTEQQPEADRVSVSYREIPLSADGAPIGTAVLLRDVTDLRRRERELITKDATIREVHHRVKNNLQTVAALLRLQSRRTPEPGARAALDEAVRRVGSIALVHETLSTAFDETVDFDQVADRLIATAVDVGSADGAMTAAVSTEREGSFGLLAAETATPLAMVLTELLQNALEHGLADAPGQVVVRASREAGTLVVEVEDDGRGLPEGFTLDGSQSLGLSIVRTLVESELGGELTIGPGSGRGTRVRVLLRVRP